MDINAIICSKMTLERCKSYVGQIHAVVHLCRDDDRKLTGLAADNVSRIASLLESEIQAGYDMLKVPDQDK
jgi:hypothetical protein